MIDCHLHLQDVRFSGRSAEILSTVRLQGVRHLLVNGTEPRDWGEVGHLAAHYPEVIPFFGLHPWKVGKEGSDWLDELESRLRSSPGAGVGEIGLDRWIRDADLPRQKEAFVSQLALAHRLERPVAVHCLKAWGSLIEALEASEYSRGPLLHSYGGPREMVQDFVALGAYFSISGYFFRPDKTEKLAAFDEVPPDRLLIETDAPDMSPPQSMIRFDLTSDDGENLNHPANLPAIYEAVASRMALSVGDLIDLVKQNFSAWYGATRGTDQEATADSRASERSLIP